MIDFGIELLSYCKKQAQDGKPLSNVIYDENNNITCMSIYDEASNGLCPIEIYKTRKGAINLIRQFKYLLCPIEEDCEVLGDYYDNYIDSLCRCLAAIDYNHLRSRFSNIVDYDFYECCLSEGIEYNRLHYISVVSPELTSFRLKHGLYTHSDELCWILSTIKKSPKIKNGNIAIRVNKTTLINIPGCEVLEEYDYAVMVKKYNQLINSKKFQSEILPKFPNDIREFLCRKERSIGEINQTELAFYVQAIKDVYRLDITDALFEIPLGIRKNYLSKKRGTHWRSNNPEECSWMLELKAQFPDYDPNADRREENKFK